MNFISAYSITGNYVYTSAFNIEFSGTQGASLSELIYHKTDLKRLYYGKK